MNEYEKHFLPYGRQHVEDDDIAAVIACLRSDWLTQGPAVEAFEAALAARLQIPHVVVCSNGTTALHLAALAAGLEPGTTAVVPSITFLATANAVRHAGGEVIFSDVDPSSGLMRPTDLREALERHRGTTRGERIVAAFPVHLNGQTAEMDALRDVAREYGIRIVEDACHALGAERRVQNLDGTTDWYPVGACRESWAACFSFHPVKSIATGEGGAVALTDAAAANRIRTLRSHGIVRGDDNAVAPFDEQQGSNGTFDGVYAMHEVGFNYRITDIQCALGLSQLGKLDRFIARRRMLAKTYDEAIVRLGNLASPIAWRADCRPAYHLYPILISAAVRRRRSDIMRELRLLGIGTQVHYIPVHRQPYYVARYGRDDLPGADSYFDRTLSLPIFVDMTPADVDRIVDALGTVLASNSP